MQRLFSTFADGWPGGGLLLLRLLAASALISPAIGYMNSGPAALMVLQIAGAAAGVLIFAGLWTPVAGVLAAIEQIAIGFTPGAHFQAITLALLAISLAMIGPGAWSIDAWLYGRKQIIPPE